MFEHIGAAFVQVTRAAVVAEALPKEENIFQGGAGEGVDGGKARHPLLVVWDDGIDARLLAHDLADPDGVGVAGSAPRQRSLDALVPCVEGMVCSLCVAGRQGVDGGRISHRTGGGRIQRARLRQGMRALQ